MPQDKKQSPTQMEQNPTHDPYRIPAIGFAAMIALTPVIAISAVLYGSAQTPQPDVSEALALSAAMRAQSVTGVSVYMSSCVTCHGADGEGVARLGKPLRNSAYVQASSDEQLFELIDVGRLPADPLNTTGSVMPPRGAQNIDDNQINKVIAYLREMQDPSAPHVSMSDWDLREELAAASADSAGGEVHPGQAIFVSSCSACHGANGEGVEGLGKPFTTSVFVAESSDKELKTMIMMGRPIWDAANTTGIDMPPKGGNPALSSDDLDEIIGYIRSISTVEN